MKTKDGYEYKDGMTLYSECLGEVIVKRTKRLDPHSDCGEYADGDPKLSVHIPSHYYQKEAAFIDATNYWLRVMNQAREKLAALNKERNEWLFRDHSPSKPASSTEPAAIASANVVAGFTGSIH